MSPAKNWTHPPFFMIGSHISLCTVIGIAPSCKAPQLQWNPETLGTWATPNWHGMFWVAAPTTSRCITSPARFEQRTGTSDPTEVLCPTRHPRSMLAAAQIFALTPRSSPCPGASRNRQKWRNDEKWPTRIHNLMFSLQNGSKHVKTCQNMSKHVKSGETLRPVCGGQTRSKHRSKHPSISLARPKIWWAAEWKSWMPQVLISGPWEWSSMCFWPLGCRC